MSYKSVFLLFHVSVVENGSFSRENVNKRSTLTRLVVNVWIATNLLTIMNK